MGRCGLHSIRVRRDTGRHRICISDGREGRGGAGGRAPLPHGLTLWPGPQAPRLRQPACPSQYGLPTGAPWAAGLSASHVAGMGPDGWPSSECPPPPVLLPLGPVSESAGSLGRLREIPRPSSLAAPRSRNPAALTCASGPTRNMHLQAVGALTCHVGALAKRRNSKGAGGRAAVARRWVRAGRAFSFFIAAKRRFGGHSSFKFAPVLHLQ